MLGGNRAVEVGSLEPEQVLAPGEVVAGILAGVDPGQRPEREAGEQGGDAGEDQQWGAGAGQPIGPNSASSTSRCPCRSRYSPLVVTDQTSCEEPVARLRAAITAVHIE